MTTQNTDSTPTAPQPGSLEAFIEDATTNNVDTTPASVDEAYAQEPGAEVEESPAVEEQPEATPETEAEAAEPSVETPEPIQDSAQPAEIETPSETRTYSQDEWAKRESAYRKQQADAQKAIDEYNQRLAALEQQSAASQVDQQVELLAQKAEAQLEPQYGAEEARRLARDPETIQRFREGLLAQNENQQLRTALQQQAAQTEAQAKASTILHFATQYNVSEDDRSLLETAGTPEQMENLAKRLGQQNAASAPKRESPVPAGSAERLETGEAEAPSLTNAARFDALAEKHPSEWTEADVQFQREVLGGQIEL